LHNDENTISNSSAEVEGAGICMACIFGKSITCACPDEFIVAELLFSMDELLISVRFDFVHL